MPAALCDNDFCPDRQKLVPPTQYRKVDQEIAVELNRIGNQSEAAGVFIWLGLFPCQSTRVDFCVETNSTPLTPTLNLQN